MGSTASRINAALDSELVLVLRGVIARTGCYKAGLLLHSLLLKLIQFVLMHPESLVVGS